MDLAKTILGQSLGADDGAKMRCFRKALQRLRTEAKLSQEGVAEKLGVSRQTVSKWEIGDAFPSTEHLLQLTSVLGCNLNELLGDDAIEAADIEEVADAKEVADVEEVAPKPYKSPFYRLAFAGLGLLLTVLCCGTVTINCLESSSKLDDAKLAVFDVVTDGFLDSTLTEIDPKIKKTVVGYGFSEETGSFYVKCEFENGSAESDPEAPCAAIIYFCSEDCIKPYSCQYLDDAGYTPQGEFHSIS